MSSLDKFRSYYQIKYLSFDMTHRYQLSFLQITSYFLSYVFVFFYANTVFPNVYNSLFISKYLNVTFENVNIFFLSFVKKTSFFFIIVDFSFPMVKTNFPKN